MVHPHVLAAMDDAGELRLGKHGVRGLAAWFSFPEDVVERGVNALVDDGRLVIDGGVLLDPTFEASQRCKHVRAGSDRMAAHRARKKRREIKVGGDAVSRGVTSVHITPQLAQHSTAQESTARDQSAILAEALRAIANVEHEGNAKSLHDAVERALGALGFECSREVAIADRGDGRRGLLDLHAKCGTIELALELDWVTPRGGSLLKLQRVKGIKVMVLRDGSAIDVPGCDFVVSVRDRIVHRVAGPNGSPFDRSSLEREPYTSKLREVWDEGVRTATGVAAALPARGYERDELIAVASSAPPESTSFGHIEMWLRESIVAWVAMCKHHPKFEARPAYMRQWLARGRKPPYLADKDVKQGGGKRFGDVDF